VRPDRSRKNGTGRAKTWLAGRLVDRGRCDIIHARCSPRGGGSGSRSRSRAARRRSLVPKCVWYRGLRRSPDPASSRLCSGVRTRDGVDRDHARRSSSNASRAASTRRDGPRADQDGEAPAARAESSCGGSPSAARARTRPFRSIRAERDEGQAVPTRPRRHGTTGAGNDAGRAAAVSSSPSTAAVRSARDPVIQRHLAVARARSRIVRPQRPTVPSRRLAVVGPTAATSHGSTRAWRR
jgi:hypothetical protein